MTRGPRKLRLIFGSTSLTHYGGVYLLHRFFSRLRLKKRLTQQARLIQRNNRYSVGEMLLALLYPMILGLERIETAQLLRQNGVFQYLTGLPSYPDATTLRRFLLRVAPVALPRLRALHDQFLQRMTIMPHRPTRLIFDVDSTVLVVYGQQEQARRGYNPIKRGRPSYHPLLCFEGQSKDFWHGELRPGDVHTASGTLNLLTACLAKIPSGVRSVLVRADKEFYDHALIAWLEELAGGLRHRRPPDRPDQTQVGAPALRKSQPRNRGGRVPLPAHPVASRLPLRRHPTAAARGARRATDAVQVGQVSLPGPGYESTLATAQPLALLQRPCRHRTPHQTTQRGLCSGKHPHAPLLRERDLLPFAFAYNLVNWFKRLCLPEELQNATLQTLRHRILLMPAQLRRTDNRPRLLLPVSGPREAAWKYALQQINKLKL
jgi:hypothetical protein